MSRTRLRVNPHSIVLTNNITPVSDRFQVKRHQSQSHSMATFCFEILLESPDALSNNKMK